MKRWIISNAFNSSGTAISSGCAYESWWQSRGRTDIRNRILSTTSPKYPFSRRVLLFLEDKEYVKCVECGSPVYIRKAIRCSKKECRYSTVRSEKIKRTKKLRYGNANYNNRGAAKDTKVKRYGDASYNNREAAKATCLEKYGASTYGGSIQGKCHISEVKLKLFNATLPKDVKEIIESPEKLKIAYYNYPFNELVELLGVSTRCLLDRLISYGIHTPNSPISTIERGLYQFIKSVEPVAISNDRKLIGPKELDVVVSEKKVAFELNGRYWHSVLKGKDINYHLNKTKQCEAKGYQLFHVFDSEWYEKKEIWKSVIKNALGFCDKKIGARQCKLKQLSSRESKSFCEANHLQGQCQSSINYALMFEDEIVSLMTFGKSRFSKKYDWELIRFCSKLNHRIHGGASRLLSHFRKHHPGRIVSYANRRWSTGHLYETLGFDYLGETRPNYFYFKNEGLESRHKYQKHKLKNVLAKFDDELSEWENMKLNGYNKIYDSGNKVYCLS